MKYFGFSIYVWIVVLVFIVFSNYIFKTIYGTFYKVVTGREIGSSFYSTGRYGAHDYSYDLGKSIFRI